MSEIKNVTVEINGQMVAINLKDGTITVWSDGAMEVVRFTPDSVINVGNTIRVGFESVQA